MGASGLLDLTTHGGEATIAVVEGEGTVRVIVTGHAAAGVAILAAGCLGDDFTVGVDVEKSHLQVATNGFVERGPVEETGDVNQRVIHRRRVDRSAFFGVLAVGIEVDGFGEPLVDPSDITRIRIQSMG